MASPADALNQEVGEDVPKRLRDKMHYLYSDQDHYWLDTKPNLRREMEGRKQNILLEEVDARPYKCDQTVRELPPPLREHTYSSPSGDVPDDLGAEGHR